MTKKAAYGIISVAVLLAATVFLTQLKTKEPSKEGSSSPPNTVERIKVAQYADVLLYLPAYIASEAGIFRTNGLDVSFVSTGGDEKTFAAVISGDAQFGIADPTFVPIARMRGQKGKVIASVVNGVPFWGVTKNPKVSMISQPKDLAQFSVATFPSPSTAFALQEEMFKKGGLKPNIRQGGFGTLLTLLENGNVDIALEIEPNVSTAVKNGARVAYCLSDFYGDFALTGVTTTEETIAKRPLVTFKFVKSLAEAEKMAHSNPAKAIECAIRHFSTLDAEVVSNAVRRLIDAKTIPKIPVISEDAWRKACQLRVDSKELPSLSEIGESLDNTFAKKATE